MNLKNTSTEIKLKKLHIYSILFKIKILFHFVLLESLNLAIYLYFIAY